MKATLPHRFAEEQAPVHRGADAVVHGVAGNWRRRKSVRKQLEKAALQVDYQSNRWSELADPDLQKDLRRLREQCSRQGNQLHDSVLIESVAALREAAMRTLGLRAYPVQIMGVLALNDGVLAEMATGEGKTLSAGLAAAVSAFRRRPCHVITVNDYLVQRDAKRLLPFFKFCGLQSGAVIAGMNPQERREVYRKDIVYVTSKEILADFLRDRLSHGHEDHPTQALIHTLRSSPGNRTRREPVLEQGLVSAIVDEADSVLIDEAVTPLIISQRRENATLKEAVEWGARLASSFEEHVDYKVDPTHREISLTKSGETKLESLAESLGGLWRATPRRWEILRSGLIARAFYHRGKQYLIEDGKIVIVDEFTGRPMPQRTWRQGLHQAIEAKEGLEITAPSETVARMSFQRFFRGYRHLAGMTGTAMEAASEFWQVYQLPVMRIPENRPCIRRQRPLVSFSNAKAKWEAVAARVQEIHDCGQPVLVGTRNVRASEQLAEQLFGKGLTCQILNAARLAEEALVIAKAGEISRITIATNMAGRGTDITLDDHARAMGGLFVIATEPHESSRIDRQLFGRAGRQGDPGCAQLFVSLEDELFEKFLSPADRALLSTGLFPARAVRRAQRRAERMAFNQRRRVLETDDWLDRALSFASGR